MAIAKKQKQKPMAEIRLTSRRTRPGRGTVVRHGRTERRLGNRRVNMILLREQQIWVFVQLKFDDMVIS